MKRTYTLLMLFGMLWTLLPYSALAQSTPPLVHPKIGTIASAEDGSIKITLVGKRQNFGGTADTRDAAINSPKSANIHPDGSKYYINSLEGGTTVVFEMGTNRRLKIISHNIGPAHEALWSEPSPLYPFTHYPKSNVFMGKPVEAAFSHGGRYLWVPYYRRSYDINAQDPSAVAIIDTQTDEIVRMMETGPLPKMVAVSHDNKHVAITHWGNNTVGLIDISSQNPTDWKHEACIVVNYVLPLNYSTTVSVDRDNGSGYALRGTVFTPDDRYLLVGCMGGGGGIAVIDMQTQSFIGRVQGMMSNVRHLVIRDGWLYLSINGGGYVQRIRLDKFLNAAQSMESKTTVVAGWESCKVGTGARTIELSPSGRYVFAACNNASQVCVVDTRTMKLTASIACDSYPVGLDISKDGRFVIVTSQGRRDKGGNAVNIYEVTYREPETPADPPSEMGASPTEEANNSAQTSNTDNAEPTLSDTNWIEENASWLAPSAICSILAGVGLWAFIARKK